MMRMYLANSVILRTGKIINFLDCIIMVCVVIIICSSTPVFSVDNLGLLMGTLLTHKQISCINQPVTLRCPSTTNVIIEVAQYISFVPTKESNICDTSEQLPKSSLDNQLKNCQWHKSLQYSLLQTAVEACRSKEQCQFQVPLPKNGINPCPNIPAYTEVKYQCRPSSFNSTVGCEHETINFECSAHTRLAIFSASYGRTQYQSVQCPQPQGVAEETCLLSYATELVIEQCHGKRNCSLTANSKTFKNPCKEKSRVYLKVVYACVPRKVLLEKYEEGPYFNEYSLEDEIDQHNELDNPESLAPYPDATSRRKYSNESNSSAIQRRPVEDSAQNSTYSDNKEKLYIYLIGGISGFLISLVILAIARLIWKKRSTRSDDKYRENNSIGNTSLPPSFNDAITEVDADITMAEIMPPVTVISSHHHISSPSEVVRYGKEGITPRSLYHDDNNQFYYG